MIELERTLRSQIEEEFFGTRTSKRQIVSGCNGTTDCVLSKVYEAQIGTPVATLNPFI